MSNQKFGVKEVMDVTFYDTVTNKPVLFCDTLKMTNLENTAESSSARGGKGNSELIIWDFGRESKMAIQDALLSPKSFELLSGNKTIKGVTTIHMRQSSVYESVEGKMQDKGKFYPLKANSLGEIDLAFEPKEIAGDILVYLADDDGGTALVPSALTGKKITCAEAKSKEVVVYYTYEVAEAETYTITADSFPGTFKIVGDTVVRNQKTGKDEAFQVVIRMAKLEPNFNMDFAADGDPSAFDMNIKILRESNNPRMVEMIKY